MSPLPEIDAARLRKIVGLFDSPVATEATAAFNAARSVASRCGVPLVDALASIIARPTLTLSRERGWSPQPVEPTMPWRRKLQLCRDAEHLFSFEAREFLQNLGNLRRAPSAAQLKWLDDLHSRAVRHFGQERAA